MTTFCEGCGVDMGAGEDKLCAQCHNSALTLEKKPRFTVNQFGTVYEDGIPRFSLMGDVQAALHSLNGQAEYIVKLRKEAKENTATLDAASREISELSMLCTNLEQRCEQAERLAAIVPDLYLLFYRIKRRGSKADTMGTGIETLASSGMRIIEATGYRPNITREEE